MNKNRIKADKNSLASLKKAAATTFGTSKRFMPEPGSVFSKTQQKVIKSKSVFRQSSTNS
jgi:hypothetical protein